MGRGVGEGGFFYSPAYKGADSVHQRAPLKVCEQESKISRVEFPSHVTNGVDGPQGGEISSRSSCKRQTQALAEPQKSPRAGEKYQPHSGKEGFSELK